MSKNIKILAILLSISNLALGQTLDISKSTPHLTTAYGDVYRLTCGRATITSQTQWTPEVPPMIIKQKLFVDQGHVKKQLRIPVFSDKTMRVYEISCVGNDSISLTFSNFGNCPSCEKQIIKKIGDQ